MELGEDALEDVLALEGILPPDVLYGKLKVHTLQIVRQNEILKETKTLLEMKIAELEKKVSYLSDRDERLKDMVSRLYGTRVPSHPSAGTSSLIFVSSKAKLWTKKAPRQLRC